MDAALYFDIDSSRARTAATDLAKLQGASTQLAGQWSKTDTAIRRANGQFATAAEVVERYGNEVQQLAAKYNPALNAVYKMQQAEGELNRAVALGVLTKEQAAATLDQLQIKLRATANAAAAAQLGLAKTGKAVGTMAAGVDKAGQSSARFGSQVQNASYQVGDFFVQIASGQSATMALAQQLPQLLGGFGVLGAAMGAVVAIGGALIPMLLRTGESGKKAAEAISELNSSMSAYKESAEKSRLATADLVEQFGMGALRAKELYSQLAQIQQLKLAAELQVGLKSISESFGTLTADVARYKDALSLPTTEAGTLVYQMKQIQETTGLTVNQAEQLASALSAAKLANGPAEAEAAMKNVVAIILKARDEGAKLPVEFLKAAEEAANLGLSASSLRNILETLPGTVQNITGQTYALASAMSSVNAQIQAIISNLSNIAGFGIQAASAKLETSLIKQGVAAGEAAKRAQDYNRQLDYIEKRKDINASFTGNFNDPGYKTAIRLLNEEESAAKSAADAQYDLGVARQEAAKVPAAGGGGGGGGKSGGGSAVDKQLERTERQYQKLQLEMEQDSVFQVQKFAKDQQTLQTALDRKIITEEAYRKKMEELRIGYFGFDWEQQALQYTLDQEALQSALDQKLISYETYYQRLKDMQWGRVLNEENQSALSQDLANTASYFGQLYSLSGSSFDGLLRLQKTFAASAALIDAYRAAVGAMADTNGPFWVRLAAYGKVLAAGLGVVAAIKGGGSSGGGSGAASSATAVKQEPTREILVRLEGSPWAVDMAESILQQIYDQSKDGRVIIARDRS